MQTPPALRSIRTARCRIADRAAFLEALQGIAAAHNTHIICFNADVIAGRAHAALAVRLAARAFDEGAAISNTLEMEALLFASGSRQCSAAAAFGIHPGENRLFVCCVPSRRSVWRTLESLMTFVCEDWDTITPEKRRVLMKLFRITQKEVSAAGGDDRISDLVRERVVLLQVMR